MSINLRNCRFSFRCDRKWIDLISTKDPDIKFCDECQQEVFFCHTDADLVEAIVRNRCVAIRIENHLEPAWSREIIGSPKELRDD